MSSHYLPHPYSGSTPFDPRPMGQAGYAPGHPSYGYPQPGAGWYGASQPGQYPGYHQSQWAYPARGSAPFFNFANDRFVKGLLIGAAATYLVTNESVQRALIKGVVKTWSMLQGGVEEIRERFHDAEAELHHDSGRRGAPKDD